MTAARRIPEDVGTYADFTAQVCLDLCVKHNITLSPVLPFRLAGERRVVWMAGYVQLGVLSAQYTSTTDFAFGRSPREAVWRLLHGATAYVYVGDGVEQRPGKGAGKDYWLEQKKLPREGSLL